MQISGLSPKTRQAIKDISGAVMKTAKKILLLEIDGNQKLARELVEPGIPMIGVRLWFLISSCIIASIGLNTNSSAVIIGAMLISPLMGPILGLGFGMATASRKTIRASLQNLFFSVFICLLVSSLYFLISPFQDPTSEIITRTAPNLLDLLVAVAAAFAGVIALNTNSFAGAIPGVAIATAILPPLCASAYGIAHGNWKIALGAFYLFFVNAVAIAVISFLLFKRMHFSHDSQDNTETTGLKPAVISLSIVIVIAPLGWSLWDAWKDNFESRSVSRLVQTYRDRLEIVSWRWDAANDKSLILYNFKKATPEIRKEFETALTAIVPTAHLDLHESTLSPDMEALASQIKTSQFSDLISNPKIVEGLVKLATSESRNLDLMTDLLLVEGELSTLIGPKHDVRAYLRTDKTSSEILVTIQTQSKADRKRILRDVPRFREWIGNRLNTTQVRMEVI